MKWSAAPSALFKVHTSYYASSQPLTGNWRSNAKHKFNWGRPHHFGEHLNSFVTIDNLTLNQIIAIHTFMVIFFRWIPPRSLYIAITVVSLIWSFLLVYISFQLSRQRAPDSPFFAPAPWVLNVVIHRLFWDSFLGIVRFHTDANASMILIIFRVLDRTLSCHRTYLGPILMDVVSGLFFHHSVYPPLFLRQRKSTLRPTIKIQNPLLA